MPRPPLSRPRAGARTSSCRRAGSSKRTESACGCSRRGPTGSNRRGCSISSGCRERAWSWPGWPGRAACRWRFRPSAGTSPARSRPSSRVSPGRPRAWRAGACGRSRTRLPSWRRELFERADVILPNSRAEASQIARLFGVSRDRIRVVPNGVLPSFGTASPEPFRERWGPDPFVLSVGRIEPRKNTLGLVRAVGQLGLTLVHIGDAVPAWRDYARRMSARRRGIRLVAGSDGSRRPAPGVGLCGGPRLRAAELVRNARPGSSRGRARRDAPSRSRRSARRANTSAASQPMPARIGPTRSAARCGPAGITAPTRGWRRGSQPTTCGRAWPR